MTSEAQEKQSWRDRLFRQKDRTEREKERRKRLLRIAFSVLGGGLMICFSNFVVLIQLAEGIVLFLLVIVMGILIGLYNDEIQYAIMAGFFALVLGAIFYIGVIILPIQWLISIELGNVLILVGVFSLVRAVPIQIFAIIIGTFIGRLIGPTWS